MKLHSLAGRFSIERLLGQGGCGKVYLAADTATGRLVALKVLGRQALDNPKAFERFCREARAQAALKHPGVAGILSHELDGEEPWLALEYIEGCDLERTLRADGPLAPAAVVRLGVEVAGALAELHRFGILHRDLKPSNLQLRADDGRAVVMDLGLASLQDATVITATGQLFGTPAYLPPEVIRGEAWTTSGDLYQLGSVLHESLTGRMMIPGTSIDEVLAAATRGERRHLPGDLAVPDDLRAVIDRATDLDPRRRFGSAAEMEVALAGVAMDRVSPGGGPGPVARSVPGESPTQPDRSGAWGASVSAPGGPASRRGRWVLLGLFLVGLGLGFLDLLGGPRPPQDVRWTVVGDVLVVSFRDEGRGDFQLRLGSSLVTPVAEVSQGRRHLIHRGLPEGQSLEVRLVWGGGQGEPERLQGEPPAVRELIGLAEGRAVEVEVLRPCKARWGDSPATRFELNRGRALLPLPATVGSMLVLEWQEHGVEFSARWPRRGLFERSLERLRSRLDATDWVEALRARQLRPGREGGGFDEERKAWSPILPWVPGMLLGDLDRGRKQWLWRSLQHWQESVAAEVFLGDSPTWLEVPEGEPGSRSRRDPPWKAAGEAALRLEPLDGARPVDDGGRIFQVPEFAAGNPAFGRRALDYSSRVRFSWPTGLPEHGTACLTLNMDRSVSQLLVRVAPAAAGTQDLVLEYWNPDPENLRLSERTKGLATACFPLDLAPPGGAEMHITAPYLLGPVPQFQAFRPDGHWIRWRTPEPAAGDPR